MRDLFKKEARPILIKVDKAVKDKYGFGEISSGYSTYISINAIVNSVDYARIIYKLPGVKTDEAKEIIFEKESLNTFLMSKKIIIDGNEYYGWTDNSGKNRYRPMDNFISAYIYRRN